MQVIVTEAFRKLAASWDDQPGFVNRDMNPGGIGQGGPPPNFDEVANSWEIRKRKNRLRRGGDGVIRVYQLGLEFPKTRKEEAKTLINL